jgi:addiction module RelE/StbE family toxin
MPKVNFTEQALSDLERIFQFLEQEAPEFAITVGEEIVDATSVLQRHPLIGRPAPHNLRELVISKGHSGYVALYRFLPSKGRIYILAIRHQRESGFID